VEHGTIGLAKRGGGLVEGEKIGQLGEVGGLAKGKG
jgi:hypothetical protein